MKLYSISKWNELYENSRSRVVIDLMWVKVPNRHDGENYTALITHKSGSILFSAWILLVQVASKCDPRGTLIRDNKQPHTPLSLSLKTRAPLEWFEITLDYLITNTDWLEVKELADGCYQPVTLPSPSRHGSAEEGREGIEGMEGNRDVEIELPKSFPRTVDDAINQCMKVGADPLFITDLWDGAMARNGYDGAGQPIRSFQYYVAKHWPKEQAKRFQERGGVNGHETAEQREKRILRESLA